MDHDYVESIYKLFIYYCIGGQIHIQNSPIWCKTFIF